MTERSGHVSPGGNKLFGLIGTSSVSGLALIVMMMIASEPEFQPSKASTPSIVSLQTIKPDTASPKRKKRMRQYQNQIKSDDPEKIRLTLTILPPSISSETPGLPKEDAPLPGEATTVPIEPVPAILAPSPNAQKSSNWEAIVLARVQRFLRYPNGARAAGQQGIADIRFRVGRDGRVLPVFLARSSDFPALDHAALDTVRRADPFPPIPSDRPDQLELTVPVEFELR